MATSEENAKKQKLESETIDKSPNESAKINDDNKTDQDKESVATKTEDEILKKPIKIKKLAKIPKILILIQILKRQMRQTKRKKLKILKVKQPNEISISCSLLYRKFGYNFYNY